MELELELALELELEPATRNRETWAVGGRADSQRPVNKTSYCTIQSGAVLYCASAGLLSGAGWRAVQMREAGGWC